MIFRTAIAAAPQQAKVFLACLPACFLAAHHQRPQQHPPTHPPTPEGGLGSNTHPSLMSVVVSRGTGEKKKIGKKMVEKGGKKEGNEAPLKKKTAEVRVATQPQPRLARPSWAASTPPAVSVCSALLCSALRCQFCCLLAGKLNSLPPSPLVPHSPLNLYKFAPLGLYYNPNPAVSISVSQSQSQSQSQSHTPTHKRERGKKMSTKRTRATVEDEDLEALPSDESEDEESFVPPPSTFLPLLGPN